jgi:dipeptidyl aminopeptidase B
LTLKTIEQQPGSFPYAMAVAPVTDWRYYDSIYTERYMLTPHDNPAGYDMSAITNVTAMSLAERFFVAHGTADDNVHVQNTFTLLDKLVSSGVDNWDSQVFADDDHNIIFHGGNKAVYGRLSEWLERYFGRRDGVGRPWHVEGDDPLDSVPQ